jgi:hypothetical protein
MSELSEIGLLTIITLCCSLLIIIIKIILKSKCYEFNCCFGLFHIKRDVKIEGDIEIQKLDHNIKSDDNININEVISGIKNNNIIK